LQLLYRIAKDPLIAEYIESMDLTEEKGPSEMHANSIDFWSRFLDDENAGVAILKLLETSKVLFNPWAWLMAMAEDYRVGHTPSK
jgi:hypothetical protein